MLRFFSSAFGQRPAPSSFAFDEAERLASYPPPYPTGWYPLVRSADLGQTPIEVKALGRSFVLFRKKSDGRPAALDAHCPHLGANLAGGRVAGDCIECPFHRWQFAADGRIASIPYSEHPPRNRGAGAYETEELHGFVFVHHGEAAPAYRPRRIAEIDSGELLYRGEYDAGEVRMHLIEFAENSADMQHFGPLHGDMLLPFTTIRLPGLPIRHRAKWTLDPDEPHVAHFENEAYVEVRGKRPEGAGATAKIRLEGPGGLVVFDFEVRKLGRLVMLQTHLPVGPLRQHVRFRWYAAKTLPRPLVAYVVGSWVSQWRRDVEIWERKVYRRRPLLAKEDGPVHALRRWYEQFYAPRADEPARTDSEEAQANEAATPSE